MNAFSEKLIVESRRGQVLVKMTFKNQSERTVFVPNEIAVERDLSRTLFEISDEDGNKIAYIGIMARRAAPTADDYHPIKAHSCAFTSNIIRRKTLKTTRYSTV